MKHQPDDPRAHQWQARLAPDYPDAWRLRLDLLRQQGQERRYLQQLQRLRQNQPHQSWPNPRRPHQRLTLAQQTQLLDRGLNPWLRWQLNYQRHALHPTLRTALWWGREQEYAPSLGILESRVIGLGGGLSRENGPWRLNLDALWHRQGQRYTRGGIHLALQRRI